MSTVQIYRCCEGHDYFHKHQCCPRCGAALEPVSTDGSATLIADTTVRVNPSGRPFRLGLARVASGATTLCFVDDTAVAVGQAISLESVNGVYHATRAD